MNLDVHIVDARPEVLRIWESILGDIPWLTLGRVQDYKAGADSEALLMPGVYAHERFGGAPIHMQAQLLSTIGSCGFPPWVVTTPPVLRSLSTAEWTAGSMRTPERGDVRYRTKTMFVVVLSAISEFNRTHVTAPIRRLVIDLELINVQQDEAFLQADAAREAFREYDRTTGTRGRFRDRG